MSTPFAGERGQIRGDTLQLYLPPVPRGKATFTIADQKAGHRYDVSILQAEFSLTQVLDRPGASRGLASAPPVCALPIRASTPYGTP
jgi:hypothetical protein